MTVSELIEKLKILPPDALVVGPGDFNPPTVDVSPEVMLRADAPGEAGGPTFWLAAGDLFGGEFARSPRFAGVPRTPVAVARITLPGRG